MLLQKQNLPNILYPRKVSNIVYNMPLCKISGFWYHTLHIPSLCIWKSSVLNQLKVGGGVHAGKIFLRYFFLDVTISDDTLNPKT